MDYPLMIRVLCVFVSAMVVSSFSTTFFRRRIKDYWKGFVLTSLGIALVQVFIYRYTLHLHAFMNALLIAPLLVFAHKSVVRDRWIVALIESMLGYMVFRVVQMVELAALDPLELFSLSILENSLIHMTFFQYTIPCVVLLLIQRWMIRMNIGSCSSMKKIWSYIRYYFCLIITAAAFSYFSNNVYNVVKFHYENEYWDEVACVLLTASIGVYLLWKLNKKEHEDHYRDLVPADFKKNKYREVEGAE